jgi:hypothetical protein
VAVAGLDPHPKLVEWHAGGSDGGPPLYSISDLGSSEAMHSDASIAEREAALNDFHSGLSSLRSLT